MNLASARQRIFAYIFDSTLWVIPAVMYFLYLYRQDPNLATSTALRYGILLAAAANAYFILTTYFLKGQTVGKKLLRIAVVGEKGALSLKHIVLRYVVLYFVPYVFGQAVNFVFGTQTTLSDISIWAFNIAYIAVMFHNKDRQMLHDMVGKTKVVQVK